MTEDELAELELLGLALPLVGRAATTLRRYQGTLAEYANEDNWGRSPNEDREVWQRTKNGYRLAELALEAQP